MYSLYRAWLSLTPNLPPPLPMQNSPLNLSGVGSGSVASGSAILNPQFSGSPDVILQVGPGLTEFSAHRTVLSAHSGFFKASLINRTDPTPIIVPNVNVDEFSSLLTFMYTGYLDLNINNIYNILLATHILHMPRALEVCRNFLMQNQPTIENRTKLVKPIPSRKPAIPHQPIFPPIAFNLTKSEETPFKSVSNQESLQNQPSTSKMDVSETKEKNDKKNSIRKSKNNDKVIIDVACCDGPVRFHRVLNKNYGSTDIENEYQIEKVNRNDAMNKLMTENISKRHDSDENRSNSEVFTCLYCNHTFKSQYCYQKHARRHLNPVSLDSKLIGNVEGGNGVEIVGNQQKREVKPLDMNVQYYPCKTCGSKFPSYYFVHKHRKLCHAEEMADNNNKNNEMVAENHPQNSNESTKTSVIDVVETDDVK